MALRRMLPDVSSSWKSSMAVFKPEIHVFQLFDKIESKFQRHHHVFEDAQLHYTKLRYMYFWFNGHHLEFLTSAYVGHT